MNIAPEVFLLFWHALILIFLKISLISSSSPDETPIDMETIIMFASRVCQVIDHPKRMRQYAIEHLDWSVKMETFKRFFDVINEEVFLETGNTMSFFVSPICDILLFVAENSAIIL